MNSNAPVGGWYEIKSKDFIDQMKKHRIISQEEERQNKTSKED